MLYFIVNEVKYDFFPGSDSFKNRQTRRKSSQTDGPRGQKEKRLFINNTNYVWMTNKVKFVSSGPPAGSNSAAHNPRTGPLQVCALFSYHNYVRGYFGLLCGGTEVFQTGYNDWLIINKASLIWPLTCAGVSSRSSSTCTSSGSSCCWGNRWSSWRRLPPPPRRPCWLSSGISQSELSWTNRIIFRIMSSAGTKMSYQYVSLK